jgi:hypothetical protein
LIFSDVPSTVKEVLSVLPVPDTSEYVWVSPES